MFFASIDKALKFIRIRSYSLRICWILANMEVKACTNIGCEAADASKNAIALAIPVMFKANNAIAPMTLHQKTK